MTIVHIAVEVAQRLENTLMSYYRDAAFGRDASGRTLSQLKFHLALAPLKQNKSFSANEVLYVNARDDQIEMRDPRSGLYPFIMAAYGDCSDLDAVNYLLRRCPKVIASVMNKDKGDNAFVRQRRPRHGF